MNCILDTHTLIWFLEGNQLLSLNAREAIENQSHTKYISIASLWEIAIKMSLGKLILRKPLAEFLSDVSLTEFEILQINFSHILRISQLDFLHKDPFNRVIISQSLEEGLTIISKDENFPLYNVDLYR